MLKTSSIRASRSAMYFVYLPSQFGMVEMEHTHFRYGLSDAICDANSVGGFIVRDDHVLYRSSGSVNVPLGPLPTSGDDGKRQSLLNDKRHFERLANHIIKRKLAKKRYRFLQYLRYRITRIDAELTGQSAPAETEIVRYY